MIGKIYRGNGVRGVLNYISEKSQAHLIATNLEGTTPRDLARQFGEVRALYPRDHVAQPVAHLILRPADGEDLSTDQWRTVAEQALQHLGYDNSPFVAYLHSHDGGRHLHIATYRVTFEGKLVSDSKDYKAMMAFSAKVAAQYGLTHAPASKTDQRDLTRAEIRRRLAEPNREAALATLRATIDRAGIKTRTYRDFLTELHRSGVEFNLKVASKSGQVQGISFTLPDGSTLRGSDLGKRYSFAAIANRHELRADLKPQGDFVQIRGVHGRQYNLLLQDGLRPDFLRQSARGEHTLGWHLPQNRKQEFVDMIASRIPAGFITYPAPPPNPPSPEVLTAREKAAELWAALLERPSAAPRLALQPPAPDANKASSFASRVDDLLDLSRQLLVAPNQERLAAYADLQARIIPEVLEGLRGQRADHPLSAPFNPASPATASERDQPLMRVIPPASGHPPSPINSTEVPFAIAYFRLEQAETEFFRLPSPQTAVAWREATAQVAANREASRAHRSPAQNSDSVDHPRPGLSDRVATVARRSVRILEQELLGNARRADRMAARLASSLAARTPIGRLAQTALHPARTAIRNLPGGSLALQAYSTSVITGQALRRAYATYLELRAAHDRLQRPTTLAGGDFSSRALAEAAARAPRAAVVARPVPATLPEAIRESRSSEAALRRAYRSARRNPASKPQLALAARDALQARANLTACTLTSLGVPSFPNFAAALGSTSEGARALTGLVGVLDKAGFTPKTIAFVAIEAAPFISLQLGAAALKAAATRVVRQLVNYFKLEAKAIVDQQTRERR